MSAAYSPMNTSLSMSSIAKSPTPVPRVLFYPDGIITSGGKYFPKAYSLYKGRFTHGGTASRSRASIVIWVSQTATFVTYPPLRCRKYRILLKSS